MSDWRLVSSDSSETDALPRVLLFSYCKKTIIAVHPENISSSTTLKQDLKKTVIWDSKSVEFNELRLIRNCS